jgi:RES domain-containing protein
MVVYRIVQGNGRTKDLSASGAFKYGGRWNNVGIYMLYTSENRSLALLENLVHYEEEDTPPDLYIVTIGITDAAPLYNFPDNELPNDWRGAENLRLKSLGDAIMNARNYLGFRASSAVLTEEFNLLLNPLFPGFNDLVKIVQVTAYQPDKRLF